MNYFDGVIVVEGKNDVSFLSSFINSEYVILNGYDMPKNTLEYLSHIRKGRQIILLTDPDEAGAKIRERFLNLGISCETVLLDYKKCNKNNKHGVAECDKAEVLEKLSKFLKEEPQNFGVLQTKDLEILGLISDKNLCDYVKFILHLGECNTKTLLKRLNYNNVDFNTIKKAIENR